MTHPRYERVSDWLQDSLLVQDEFLHYIEDHLEIAMQVKVTGKPMPQNSAKHFFGVNLHSKSLLLLT